MKKTISIAVFLCITLIEAQAQKNATITVVNNTDQDILNIKYFRGTELQSSDPQKRYSSRAGIKKGATTTIPVTFQDKKDRKIIIKGELTGGGETADIEHTLERDEVTANVELIINPGQLPKDPVQQVYNGFKTFELTSDYINLNSENAYETVIGSVFFYNQKNEIIDIIYPEELKSKNLDRKFEGYNQDISSLFTREVASTLSVKVPFVSLEGSFDNNELLKFTWTIKSAGPVLWQAVGSKGYVTLFNELPKERLDALYNLYINNDKKITARFINRAFIIRKLHIKKESSKKLVSGMKVDGSTFVTATGNFKVTAENLEVSTIENVVTKIDGFDVTHLLQNLAFTRETDLKNLITEYTLYRERYPELPELPNNATAAIINQAIKDLNKKLNGNLTLLKTSELSLADVSKSQAKVGEVVNLTEEKKVEEKKQDTNKQ